MANQDPLAPSIGLDAATPIEGLSPATAQPVPRPRGLGAVPVTPPPVYDPSTFVADYDPSTFEPDQPRGALRGAADLALEVGSGAIKGVKFISDAAGASNPVSDVLANADTYVKGLQSAQAKGEDQRMAAIMAEAQDAGVWEQVKSAFSAAGEAPVRSALGALGTSAPTIAASLLPGVGQATWGARLAALGGLSGVQGAGVVKGSIYDAVERRMLEANATPEQAAAEASRQQEYGGPNSPNIMLAGGLGVATGITGVQPAIVRALVGGAGRKTAQELVRSMLTGLVKEAPLEAAQGGQEQFAQNIAEQNAGFDTPTWRGVAGNWALEGLLAAPGGLAGGALDTMGGARPAAPPSPTDASPTTAPTEPPAPQAPPTPEAVYADLSAQHTAVTEQMSAAEAAVAQAQQEHDALVAARAALDAEAKLPLGERRTKSEITIAKKAATAQVKAARARIEELGGDVFAARTALDTLTPQLEAARLAVSPEQATAPTAEMGAIGAGQQPVADDTTELEALIASETRDVELRRAEMQRGQQKERELDAIAIARTEELGRTPDQQIAAAQVATDETPTAMAEAFARAKPRTEAEQIDRAVKGVQAAVQPTPTVSETPAVAGAPEAVAPTVEGAPEAVTPTAAAAPEAVTPAPLATNIHDYIVEELAKKKGTPEKKIKLAASIDTAIADITTSAATLAPDLRPKAIAAMVKTRVGGKVSADVQNEIATHIEQVVRARPRPGKEQVSVPSLVAESSFVGTNSDGAPLYEGTRGRFRIRHDRKDMEPDGYADFGGDLSPVEPTSAGGGVTGPTTQFSKGATAGTIGETADMFAKDFATKRTTLTDTITVSTKGDTKKVKRRNTNSQGRQVSNTVSGLRRFWDWYAGSPEDSNGRPILLYHSTAGDITVFETMRETTNTGMFGEPFETRREGIFMTPNAPFAEEYSEGKIGANTMQVYARMQNPADFRHGMTVDLEHALQAQGVNTRAILNLQHSWEMFEEEYGGPELVAAMKAAGYDGAIINEVDANGKAQDTYVAFDPEQVKSATGNRGSWADTNPSILASNAALTQDEFEAMPPAAQEAATTAYNDAMRQKGVALQAELASIIGDRPELKVVTFAAEPGGPIGSYTRTGPLKAVISMATNAKSLLGVADHEGYHFAEDWLLTSSEKRIVANAMKPGKPLFEQLKARLQQYDRENRTNLTDEVTSTPAEARAYGFEFWRRGELQAEGHLARIWQKLQQLFERISNAVKGVGFQSVEDVFVALSRGQMAEREMVAPEERGAYESRGADYTQTPAFKKWFGDSKVVDAAGKPLVVYHSGSFNEQENGIPIVNGEGFHFGTKIAAEMRDSGKRVDDFIKSAVIEKGEDTQGNSAWFWSSEGVDSFDLVSEDGYATRAEAEQHMKLMATQQGGDWDSEPMHVTRAYLSFQNPKRMKDHGADWTAAVAGARAEGHDGIIYRNEFEDKGKDSYIAFFPTQIKSATGNTGAFDPNNPDIRFSAAGGQAWYRSALADAVAGIASKQASAQGWKDQIKGLIAKGAAKQVELDAVGLNDWLDLQQGKITKDQVMAFLGENGVRVEEVVLGGEALTAAEEARYLELNGMNNRGELAGRSNRPLFNELVALRKKREGDEPKFSGYQLPGGENYRELLLTLPHRAQPEALDPLIRTLSNWPSDAKTAKDPANQSQLDDLNAEWERRAAQPNFRSSHYDQPNILAHVRFNERIDADGKRVLFLEELQSDWAQAGRKKGFAGAMMSDPRIPELRQLQEKAQSGRATDAERAQFYDLWDTVYEQYGIPSDTALSDILKPGIPSAPFVGKTEAWTALALKRMIRYAAENGFDKIAWTTGEQQATRYDLSKSIMSVAYSGSNLKAFDHDGQEVISETGVRVEDLPDYIGKEAAEKLMAQEPQGTLRVLEGQDLKVGGEGMKGYYDKIVPSVANDILKKLGGGRVERIAVPRNGRAGKTMRAEDVDRQRKEGTLTDQPGFTITPQLAERAANGLPLFSKAAVEMANRKTDGGLEAIQLGEQYAHLVDAANTPNDIWTRALGIVKEDMIGGAGRWWVNNISTPNFISASSEAFKNVYQAFNTYIRYGKILNEQLVRERLPAWYKASDADRKAAFDVMLKRTVEKYSKNSQELADLLRTLTPEQRTLYDQATDMIAGVLQRQFESQKATRKLQLTTPGEYEKWLARRQEQVDSLLDTGYVPLRRYGDYSVAVYMEAPDGTRVKAGLEFFNSPSAAKAASIAYAREIERSGAALKVELGHRSKNERDTGVSLEQFLGTLRRQGIDISQAERERLVVAMTNADSLVRTQMMHREGLAGFSTDSMRVLHEFGVNTTNEIAYARFAPVLDAALDGAEVVADVNSVTGEPVITIGESFGQREDGVENNLWKRDGPMSGFHKDRANALADAVLVPNRQSAWATKLRTAGVMYFIGGSISGAAVNAMSIPMLLVPHLSMHTDYLSATTTAMKSWKDSWQNYNILRDIDRMKNPDAETAAKLDAAGITKGMRAAIVAAADHIFDTEIHMMLGISQGTLYSKSRNLQRAAELWMAPFRAAEQTNRLASFMAAYKMASTTGVKQADGSLKTLGGQELFRFASGVVDATQNNYNASNSPGIMNNPVGALMFQFKSFPLFIIEAVALMHKQSPKSAVYMMLGLTAMAGVQGLPFAEELLDLIDVISQKLFGSPFNSRRAMRNAIKTASDAIGVADLSDAVMRGMINEITGVNIATRVSGGLLPGTRLGAADTPADRVLSEVAGAPYSMVKDTVSNVGGFVSGVATGDWMKAADAIRAGGPIALRNIVKGSEQLSSGYASDTKGRKVTDVSTLDGLLQLTGLSSAKVTNMQDHNSIVIQVKAFHTQVSQDMQEQLVRAYRDGDTAKQQELIELRNKWNARYPNMPIMPNAAAVRRAIMLSNVPLDRRSQLLLNRRMRSEFNDVFAEEE